MHTDLTATARELEAVHMPSAACVSTVLKRLRELAPDATPATAALLRPAAKQLLRGPGHAVEHLLQRTAPDATCLRAVVLKYLATSAHCCDREQVDAMLDAGVAELIASSMHAEPGGDAHLAGQACRLLATMAYQLESAAPLEEEESRVAARMFPDATVAALVAYMRHHVADCMQFTMALTAAMKGVCDREVAERFNKHGIIAAMEAALAHAREEADGATEVRVLRFTWQFLDALPVGAAPPLRTLAHALVHALPRTAASAWTPCDYARLMVLTRTMRWTQCFARKTLQALRSLCVTVLTHTVTAENVLGGFCCLYLFSVLCVLKTPECALEGAGMPGHGLCDEVLDETCSVKQSIFWSQTLVWYRAWLWLPERKELEGIVVQFLRQQCVGDILSKYVEPGVCTAGACEELLHCCSALARDTAPTHTVVIPHHLHLAMVSVQRGLSPSNVVLAALGTVRAFAGLAAEAQHPEVRTALLLEIVVNTDPVHLRQVLLCRAVLDCLDYLLRGGGKVHVLQGSGASSLQTCVERELYVLLQPEHARIILHFFAQNLVLLAACKTDAVFAALVCHAIRVPEDIVLLVTHGLNVGYIIEFFGVKVTEGCTFFGVWLLAGLLGACVEKQMPMPQELETLVCSIGPRGFARALDKLEAAAVAGRTVTPLAFSLYFWHLLVAAVDNKFDESASKALAAAGTKFATGVSKRFADMLAETLESREEQRKVQQALALKKADALLEELVREDQAQASKAKRSRRQRRAAQSTPVHTEAPAETQAVGAASGVPSGVSVAQGSMRVRPYVYSPVVGIDFSPSIAERQKRQMSANLADMRGLSAEAVQFLQSQKYTAEGRAAKDTDKSMRNAGSDSTVQVQDCATLAPEAKEGMSTTFVECACCMEVMKWTERVMFVPCGHVSMCNKCASGLQSCPICRASVDKVVKPYYC